MRISDWSSDVCSSDLPQLLRRLLPRRDREGEAHRRGGCLCGLRRFQRHRIERAVLHILQGPGRRLAFAVDAHLVKELQPCARGQVGLAGGRSEEHTSELQSLMRISYAVFFLKKKKNKSI